MWFHGASRSHGFPATYPAALTSEYSTNYLHTNHGYPLKSSGHEEAKQQHQTYQYEVQPNEYPYAYYYTGHTSPQTIHPKQQAEQQDHTTQHQTQPHHQMNPSQLSSVGSQHQQIQSQLQENIPHNQVSSSTSTRPSVSQQPQQQEYAYYSQDNPLELLVSSATSSFTHTSQGSGTTPKSGTVYTGGTQQANLQGASAPGYAVGPRFQNQGPTLHQHSENLGTNTIGTSQMSDLQRHYAMKQMGIPQGYSSHYYPVASKAMQNELVSPIQAIQTQQQNHQHHHHHQQQQQQKQMGQGFDPSSIVFHPIEPVAQWKQLQVPQPIGYLQSAQRFFDPFQLPSGLTLLSPRNQTGLISSGGISTTTGVMVLPFQSSGTTDSSGGIGTEASHQLQQQQQHSQQQPNSPLNELCSLCQCGDCDRLAAPCQHPFHHICLKNFLQRSNNCPTCTKVSYININAISIHCELISTFCPYE
jgi:hypothetical protein